MALSDPDRAAVQERLTAGMRAAVTLELFLPAERVTEPDGRITRLQAFKELVDDVGSLSPKLTVVHHRWEAAASRARELGVARAPAVAIVSEGVRGRMVQYGTPAGYEFKSFLAGIVAASAGSSASADAESDQLIADLPSTLEVQIFTSPGCPHCPKMASVGFQLAATSERFSVHVIDVTEFGDLARRYAVQGIPLTVINDAVEMVGAMPKAAFLKRLLRANVPPPRGEA